MSDFDKSFDSYSQRNDYANGAELMVTITLAEYRDLISVKAKRDDEVSKKQLRIYDLEQQVTKLNAKIAQLVSTPEGDD